MNRLMLLFCAAIVFLSCYFPPYKEDLSLAVRTADKLEGRALVGPIDRSPWEFRDREIWFYPSKDGIISDSDYLRGFIVAVDDRSARLMYVGHSFINNDDYYITFDDTVPLENSDETQFGYTLATIKDGNSGVPPLSDAQELLGIALFDPGSENRQYIMYDENYASRGGSPLDMNLGMETDFGLGDALVLGISFFPLDSTTNDWLHVFALDRLTGLFTEAAYDTDAGSALIDYQPAIRTGVDLPGLPDDLNTCFFYHSPLTLRSYLSVYDPVRRGYRNFSWDGALQLRILTDMERRIDLLLSNGWLFSRDGNTGYIYDAEGHHLNSFVMGGMQLVYEVFYGGEARVVFTVPAFAPVEFGDGGWNDRLFFLVYWIPTDQLADL